MHVRRTPFSLFTFHAVVYLNELGPSEEFWTDRLIVLIRLTRLCVGPGEPPADRRVVRLAVDRAPILDQEDAAPLSDPGAPFAPTGLIDHVRAVLPRDHLGFVVAQGDAVGAAGRRVRARKAGQLRMGRLSHLAFSPIACVSTRPSRRSAGRTPIRFARVGAMSVVLTGSTKCCRTNPGPRNATGTHWSSMLVVPCSPIT